jgi:hypothetical protein
MSKVRLDASSRCSPYAALALLFGLAGCDHDWSSFDPRLGDAGSGGTGGPTTVGVGVGAGGNTGSSSTSGAGAAGGQTGSGGEGGVGAGGGSGGAGGVVGHLFAIGGEDAAGMLLPEVLAAPILADGSLDAWVVAGALPSGRTYHASAHSPTRLFVLGGESGIFTKQGLAATPADDGAIPIFDPTPDLPVGLFRHSSTLSVDRLYVIGGASVGTKESAVHLAHVGPAGTLDEWTPVTPLPASRHRHASATYNSFLYVLGGSTDDPVAYTNDVLMNKIAADGTLDAAWTPVASFVETRFGLKSIATNGRVYVLGGLSGAGFMLSDVQVATMAADGGLSGWQATSPFTGGRTNHGCVLFNNRVYIAGGLDDSATLDDVQFATILADGTLSPWTTTKKLPVGRRFLTIEAL